MAGTPATSAQHRLGYIDMAKGVLVLLVVAMHMQIVIHSDIWLGLEDNPANGLNGLLSQFTKSFAMPAFFVITGYCSTFASPARPFMLKNAATLLLPALTLGLLRAWLTCLWHPGVWDSGEEIFIDLLSGGDWFLTSLFLCKAILWAQLRWLRGMRWVALTSAALFGAACALHIGGFRMNSWWPVHTAALQIFMVFGYYLRRRGWMERRWVPITCLISFVALTAVNFSLFTFESVPRIILGLNIPDAMGAAIILVSGVCGSVSIIYLCRLVKSAPAVQYAGKSSLVIYMLHIPILVGLCNVFSPVLERGEMHSSMLVILCVLVFAAGVCCLLAHILNQKYLKWLLGKF